MEVDRVLTKAERIASLRYKTARGAATLEDRLELEATVLRSDGPTIVEARHLLRELMDLDAKPALLFGQRRLNAA